MTCGSLCLLLNFTSADGHIKPSSISWFRNGNSILLMPLWIFLHERGLEANSGQGQDDRWNLVSKLYAFSKHCILIVWECITIYQLILVFHKNNCIWKWRETKIMTRCLDEWRIHYLLAICTSYLLNEW